MKLYYLFPSGIYEAKEEKPERKNFTKRSTNNQEEFWFKKCTNKWLSSCIIHPFGEGEESKFKNLALDWPAGLNSFDNALKSGILFPSERVRIKSNCCGRRDGVNDECDAKTFAYFVSIEDKPIEETQAELLNELIKIVTGLAVPPELLIKGNGFHITRK